MITWTDVWAGLLVPAATSCGLLLVAWQWTHCRMPASDSRSWAAGLSIAAGFVAGYLALFGWPGFPPVDATNWLLFLALPLAIVGLAIAWLQIQLPLRIVSIAIAVPATLVLLARPLLTAGEPIAGETAGQLVVAASIAAVSLAALDALAARISAARLSMVLTATALPAAAVLALSGTLRYGQTAGMLAATQIGTLAAYLVLGPAALARGAVLVFGTLLVGLLWCGNQYADLNSTDALILVVAPNAAWPAMLLPRRIGWLVPAVLQLLCVLGIAYIAVSRAWEQAAETPYY